MFVLYLVNGYVFVGGSCGIFEEYGRCGWDF